MTQCTFDTANVPARQFLHTKNYYANGGIVELGAQLGIFDVEGFMLGLPDGAHLASGRLFHPEQWIYQCNKVHKPGNSIRI